MQLVYFDENKYTDENPYYFVGGIVIDVSNALSIESTLSQIQFNFFGTSALTKETEFHGKDIFHGKGNYKNRKLSERIKLLEDISTAIIRNQLPIRLVCIDVKGHRRKYTYPIPEYRLGLMLILERSCDYLDKVEDIGLVFGDYEKDEITRSILDFSQFKTIGKTPMHFGRPLGRLLDTVYFTQSHHSRFLQVADVVVFMAQRFENGICESTKWHDNQVREFWENIKANVDFSIQHWP
jgi:hypothetical protein